MTISFFRSTVFTVMSLLYVNLTLFARLLQGLFMVINMGNEVLSSQIMWVLFNFIAIDVTS